jgi:hypothetical protein
MVFNKETANQPTGSMQSLVPGHLISPEDMLRSFVLALDPREIAKLVAVWTGSPSLRLTEGTLQYSFNAPDKGPRKPTTIYYWMTPEQRRARIAGEEIVLTAEQQLRSPLKKDNGSVKTSSKARETRWKPQSRQTPGPIEPSVEPVPDLDENSDEEGQGPLSGVPNLESDSSDEERSDERGQDLPSDVPNLDSDSSEASFSEDEVMADNPHGAERERMDEGYSAFGGEDLGSASDHEDVTMSPTGGADEKMEEDRNTGTKYDVYDDVEKEEMDEGNNRAVIREANDEIAAHIIVPEGVGYMDFVRRVAVVQHEMLNVEGPVVDPFTDPNFHDGESPSVSVSTCSKHILIPWADKASIMLHSLVTTLNIKITDMEDS